MVALVACGCRGCELVACPPTCRASCLFCVHPLPVDRGSSWELPECSFRVLPWQSPPAIPRAPRGAAGGPRWRGDPPGARFHHRSLGGRALPPRRASVAHIGHTPIGVHVSPNGAGAPQRVRASRPRVSPLGRRRGVAPRYPDMGKAASGRAIIARWRFAGGVPPSSADNLRGEEEGSLTQRQIFKGSRRRGWAVAIHDLSPLVSSLDAPTLWLDSLRTLILCTQGGSEAPWSVRRRSTHRSCKQGPEARGDKGGRGEPRM